VALEGYHTTTEAAGLLGLRAPTVRDAVRRGRLAVERVGGRNLVPTAEIERYRAEVLGTRGWEGRKADDGAGEPLTDAGGRARQRAYRARKRAQASARGVPACRRWAGPGSQAATGACCVVWGR